MKFFQEKNFLNIRNVVSFPQAISSIEPRKQRRGQILSNKAQSVSLPRGKVLMIEQGQSPQAEMSVKIVENHANHPYRRGVHGESV